MLGFWSALAEMLSGVEVGTHAGHKTKSIDLVILCTGLKVDPGIQQISGSSHILGLPVHALQAQPNLGIHPTFTAKFVTRKGLQIIIACPEYLARGFMVIAAALTNLTLLFLCAMVFIAWHRLSDFYLRSDFASRIRGNFRGRRRRSQAEDSGLG